MSDPSAGRAGEPTKPESFIGSLLVLVALMLVVGLGVAVYGLSVQRADSSGLYEDLFLEGAQLPYDFARAGGTAVAGKQRWVRFERPAEAAPDPNLPEVVFFGRFQGPVAVRRQFETQSLPSGESLSRRLSEWEKDPSNSAFQALLERGELEFGPFETDFVRLREYLDTGEWYDLVRVDLTTPTDAQLMVAHWPLESEAADAQTLLPFLDTIRLPDPAELAD
ncbi:MAG: hypothetical protein AAFZ65_02140 [Planctomycetota bacterium]